MFARSLYIFRRDLRFSDNTALLAAARESREVLLCFIFDDTIRRRFGDHEFRTRFLMESLEDLDRQIRRAGGSLRLFDGDPAAIVRELVQKAGVEAVFVNREYTPYGRRRDGAIRAVCADAGVPFKVQADVLINEPDDVLKKDGTPYVVFTPWHRAALQHGVRSPDTLLPANLCNDESGRSWATYAERRSGRSPIPGGREQALRALDRIGALADYDKARDYPARETTSRLSAHLRFGTCSVREAYQAVAAALGEGHGLIRQFYWRDFFTQVAFHYPHVFGHAFRRQYDRLAWRESDTDFAKWCDGRTGFPLVDAGMRELTATGYMHNRARMMTASFLVKNLHIDWRRGERFFARYLIDYDPSVNNGNWQWAASTGCDAQPWFRIFNPWRQQAKFDPEAEYIRTWLPELADWPAKRIHALEKDPAGYFEPMVDLKRSAAEIKARFRQIAVKP